MKKKIIIIKKNPENINYANKKINNNINGVFNNSKKDNMNPITKNNPKKINIIQTDKDKNINYVNEKINDNINGIFNGQQCESVYIIANGLSLLETDLSFIKNEITIGCNSLIIGCKTKNIDFIPMIHVVANMHELGFHLSRKEQIELNLAPFYIARDERLYNVNAANKVISNIHDLIKNNQKKIYYVKYTDVNGIIQLSTKLPKIKQSLIDKMFMQRKIYRHTNALLAFDIAFMLNPKNIYLIGFDYPTYQTHFFNLGLNDDKKLPGAIKHNNSILTIDKQYTFIKKRSIKKCINIYNASSNNNLTDFNFAELFLNNKSIYDKINKNNIHRSLILYEINKSFFTKKIINNSICNIKDINSKNIHLILNSAWDIFIYSYALISALQEKNNLFISTVAQLDNIEFEYIFSLFYKSIYKSTNKIETDTYFFNDKIVFNNSIDQTVAISQDKLFRNIIYDKNFLNSIDTLIFTDIEIYTMKNIILSLIRACNIIIILNYINDKIDDIYIDDLKNISKCYTYYNPMNHQRYKKEINSSEVYYMINDIKLSGKDIVVTDSISSNYTTTIYISLIN